MEGCFVAKLLRIDASSRTEGSVSRALADYFLERWQALHPEDQIVVRDLAQTVVPQLEPLAYDGFYTAEVERTPAMRAALAWSDRLIAELKAADVLLLTVPMYNFTVPASLKAYIDQVVRIHETFGYDAERGLYGLLEKKQAFVIITKGLVYSEGPLVAYEFLEPYLKALLTFLGIAEVVFITAEATSLPAREQNRQAALQQIDRLLPETALSNV
jgi:FMN-dependent NADH-azoreductase